MRANEYQERAMVTSREATLTNRGRLYHAVFGLSSEAGEVAGILQKQYQGHPIDKDHLIRELGDALWMVTEAADALCVDLEQVMLVNLEKLERRYPEGFDVERSLHRDPEDL